MTRRRVGHRPATAGVAAKYGSHAYDQWSVDELLDLARIESSTADSHCLGMTGRGG